MTTLQSKRGNPPTLDKEQDSNASEDDKSKEDGKDDGCCACSTLVLVWIHPMVDLNVVVDGYPS